MSHQAPPLPTQPVASMMPRWLAWIAATLAGPFIAVWPVMENNPDITAFWLVLGIALAGQLAASIYLARGVARKRSMKTGGIIGFSILFILASLMVGTVIFLVAFVAAITDRPH